MNPPINMTALAPDATDSRIMVAEIDAAAAAVAGCYDQLTPSAQAGAIKLGHALSDLRRRMIGSEGGTARAAGLRDFHEIAREWGTKPS